MTTTPLSERLRELAALVDAELDRILPPKTAIPETLHEAMRYSVFAGGKRVRPVLCLLCAEALGVAPGDGVRPACALELIHTYSLIHDDLPAMDDDDFRRGRPSNHKVFGEATAILAGDGLLTLAFEVLGTSPPGDDCAGLRSRAVALVAQASGWAGMVGGQELDLRAEGQPAELARVEAIHSRKTCALLHASVMLGAVLGRASGAEERALSCYGSRIGLAFQITDDVLDEKGDLATLGKTPGKDAEKGKLTYPAAIGIDASREMARSLAGAAILDVEPLGERARFLKAMANFIVERLC
ncbi:MAG: farnesyl diphosphate synthase [Acidobacteriota bacterium]